MGRYLSRRRRRVASGQEAGRGLTWDHEALAEQARLRERLRIARDMHDSLGHRLSLVSVQAAALEVAEMPPSQRLAVQRLADAARAAMDELYEVIGALRASVPGRGIGEIPSLVAEGLASGLAIDFCRRGLARQVAPSCDEAAYRVVEEGLTNAAKHAPGQPVSVEMAWEPDALLLTVANPLAPAWEGAAAAGHGLLGLGERVTLAGGFLDHRRVGGQFRLVAMLPSPAEPSEVRPRGRVRIAAVGIVAAVLMFGLVPISVGVGVSP